MTWDPPGLWATIILSILGGIVAGILVLVGEILIRRELDRRQRKRAERAIGQFFRWWQMLTRDPSETDSSESTSGTSWEQVRFLRVQFQIHEYCLMRVTNLIAAWSKYLTAKQVDELSTMIGEHQIQVIARLPEGQTPEQHQYDNFFQQARAIKWLDF